MTAPTKDRLAEIRGRLEAATPGPWEIHDSCSWRRIGRRHPHKDGDILCPTNDRSDGHPNLNVKPEDLILMAHAPTDIAWLLEENELLRRDHADGLKVTGIPHQGRVR